MAKALGSILLCVLIVCAGVPDTMAQEATCQTVEQCRLLVDVVRVQLKTAQDAWAYWADQLAQARVKCVDTKKDKPSETLPSQP